MTFLKKLLLCMAIMTYGSYSFGADDHLDEIHTPSAYRLLLESPLSSGLHEQTTSLLKGIANTAYKYRYALLATSLLYVSFTEFPGANAADPLCSSNPTSNRYPGINCSVMEPTMLLCQYGHHESMRLRDICVRGCDSYNASLVDLARGMLNLCCDQYCYFFDFY